MSCWAAGELRGAAGVSRSATGESRGVKGCRTVWQACGTVLRAWHVVPGRILSVQCERANSTRAAGVSGGPAGVLQACRGGESGVCCALSRSFVRSDAVGRVACYNGMRGVKAVGSVELRWDAAVSPCDERSAKQWRGCRVAHHAHDTGNCLVWMQRPADAGEGAGRQSRCERHGVTTNTGRAPIQCCWHTLETTVVRGVQMQGPHGPCSHRHG
jgi:hypothetical protein